MVNKIGLKLKKIIKLTFCLAVILTLTSQTSFAEPILKTRTVDELNKIADYRQQHTKLITSQTTKSDSEIEDILAKSSNRDPKYLEDYKKALKEKYSQDNLKAKFTESDDEILNILNSIEIEKAKFQKEIPQDVISNNTLEKANQLQTSVALSGFSNYNRSATVTYMDKYWNIYNPIYTNYYPEDCCNFVSQILYTGGVPGSATWCANSTAWINNHSFKSYFTGKVAAIEAATGSQIVSNFTHYRDLMWSGDAIQMARIGGIDPHHIFAVHDFADGDVKMSAHCDNYLYRSLLTVANAYSTETFYFYSIKSGY